MLQHFILVPIITLIFCSFILPSSDGRSFTIDYQNNTFSKDGMPFRYISGSIHPYRVPPYYWKDRLLKMKSAGLNTIQTYVMWNMHEPYPGMFSFEDESDLPTFIELAQSVGLLVVLRTGPYACAEWELGGLPWWLLKDRSIKMRTSDPNYLQFVTRWFSVLLPKMRPLLYSNGGPIISVQVENEYGSYYACDLNYTMYLRDLLKKYLVDDVVLFTTDGNGDGYLKCGVVPNVYPTVDFGPTDDVAAAFQAQRDYAPSGPLVNSEFYPGWLDHWGEPHSTVATNDILTTMTQFFKLGANFNFYMFHGGTNFGFMNGADPSYEPCPTSYDYDAPLNEAGDATPKYMAIRQLIAESTGRTPLPVPPNTAKFAHGTVEMGIVSTLYDLTQLVDPIYSYYPLSFEELDQPYGFVAYEALLPFDVSTPTSMYMAGVRDRAHVFIGKTLFGIFSRMNGDQNMNIAGSKGDQLLILVENQGRLNYGNMLNDNKGVVNNITINGQILTDWMHYPLDFTRWLKTKSSAKSPPLRHRDKAIAPGPWSLAMPNLFEGLFVIPDNMTVGLDTFLYLPAWTKGQVWINGFNLGRYWTVLGPQQTLYVPGNLLRLAPKFNVITIFELDFAPCFTQDLCVIRFVDTPIINGTVGAGVNMHAARHAPTGRWDPARLSDRQ